MPRGARPLHAPDVDLPRKAVQLAGALEPEGVRHERLADVFVVAALRLGGRGEQRIRKSFGELHAVGQRDPADAPLAPVFLPARPVEETAHHALEEHRTQLPDEHRASGEVRARRPEGLRVVVRVVGHEVVGRDVPGAAQPPRREAVKHPALLRNALRQHHVERGDPVRGHEQQVVVPHRVDVADLPAGDGFRAGNRSLEKCVWHPSNSRPFVCPAGRVLLSKRPMHHRVSAAERPRRAPAA